MMGSSNMLQGNRAEVVISMCSVLELLLGCCYVPETRGFPRLKERQRSERTHARRFALLQIASVFTR